MWQIVSKLFPILLATTTKWPPRSPQDLTYNFRAVYEALEAPAKREKYVSDTLRFSYVTPPINGTVSTWKDPDVNEEDLVFPEDNDVRKKPVAVLLPGLDGYGISAQQYQFDDLARTFEFWRLTILPNDNSSFSAVVKAVSDFVQQEFSDREVVIIGESCGGLFAAATAIRLRDKSMIRGLVLVNPATSFDATAWDRIVPLLTSLKYLDTSESRQDGLTPYSVAGSLILSTLIPDNDQLRRIFGLITSLPDLQIPPPPDQLQSVMDATFDAFRETEARLPPEVLEHRIQWLTSGAPVVNARLKLISVPTLVVVGVDDKLLPSKEEADRLVDTIPFCEKVTVRGRGHFVLDENVNLTEAILYSKIDPLDWKKTKKRFDPIVDWKKPTKEEVDEAIERSVKTVRTAHSPVWFSTDSSGRRWRGLGKVQRLGNDTSPILVVANHQFSALDLRLIVPELLEERGIFLRGLAHPVTFAGPQSQVLELSGRTPGILDPPNPFNGDFVRFGAVEVTPRNYYRLMQTGQDALLFPGGAKEALTARPDYPLFWPNKTDFVRTAARFNATVIPLSAIGMLESVNVLADPEQLANAPIIGDRVRAFNANMSGARYDGADEQIIGFPLALPKLPARNYFLFGKPISLADLDPKDKETCEKVYRQIESDVRRGLDDLLRAREHDPFLDTPKRLAYERVFGKQAPTFPIDELN